MICIFAFSSPATKMSWILASGDAAAVGQTVPSTTVDLLKETGTTLLASSSDVNKAGDVGKQAVIVKPPCKFGIKALAIKRAPT